LKNLNPQNWSTLLLSTLCIIFISSCGLDKTSRINESFDKGWYAKEFTLDKSYAGKSVNILFEGVYMNSDVWLNGQLK
jgi:hypothetical protein